VLDPLILPGAVAYPYEVGTVLGRFRPTADRERSISPAGSLDFLPLVHGLNDHLFPRSNAMQGHVIDAKKVAICSTDAVSTMGWAYDRGGGEGGILINAIWSWHSFALVVLIPQV
jgi:hypothetical protein